ncbi:MULTISPECIES: hypothetical protein [unclassified Mesorhizobium]|uniref:hypothetical protein n=1 Tax=unclassified Mesorhizobium TaxID=325217 RepID=UPI00333B9D20
MLFDEVTSPLSPELAHEVNAAMKQLTAEHMVIVSNVRGALCRRSGGRGYHGGVRGGRR